MVKIMSHMWLALWLVAIPLVHIHPEADHAHGTQRHKHGGVVHSVFSKDLACEFHEHSTHRFSRGEKHLSGFLHCEHTNVHLLNHDEIGFSYLANAFNDSFPSPDQSVFLLASDNLLSIVSYPLEQAMSSERSPPLQFNISHHHIRPPPTLTT